MKNINKVLLIGRLGSDPEKRYVGNDLKVARVSVATSERYKDKDGNDQEKTEWHRCQAWGKLADILTDYFHKGDLVYMEGKLRYGSYEDNGVTKYTTDITLSEAINLTGKKEGGSNLPPEAFQDSKRTQSSPQSRSSQEVAKAPSRADELPITESLNDDLPF